MAYLCRNSEMTRKIWTKIDVGDKISWWQLWNNSFLRELWYRWLESSLFVLVLVLVDEEMVLLGCSDCLILTQGQLHSMMVEEFCCHLDFVFHLYVHHKILEARKNWSRVKNDARFIKWVRLSYGHFLMAFFPNSAWGSVGTTTIGKTHPTLIGWLCLN